MLHSESHYKKLAKLVENLKRHNSYFYNFETKDIKKMYEEMPVITKRDILLHFEEYISDLFVKDYLGQNSILEYLLEVKELSANHDRVYVGKSGRKWIIETTTGSTGKPFTIVKSPSEKLIESKFLFDMRKRFYPDVNLENGFLLLQPTDNYIKSISYRGISDKKIPLILNYMFKCMPKWLLITTLLLRKLYKSIIKSNLEKKVRELRLFFIEITSQTLSLEEKVELEELFGCPIVNQFGCREVWNIAYECPCGKMHVNNKYLMVDLMDEEGKLIKEKGKEGTVILTSLLHQSFPFIKYHLADYAFFSDEDCVCGNSAPIIVFSGGRKKDKLIGSNYYGTEIFRKLMRYIYFKCPELEVKDIFITQTEEKKIRILVVLNEQKRKAFEKIFKDTLDFLIGKNYYVLLFTYTDVIMCNKNVLKPEIFENFYTYTEKK